MMDRKWRFLLILFISIILSGLVPGKAALAVENEDCLSCHNEELLEMSSEEKEDMVEKFSPSDISESESDIDVEEYLKHNKPFAVLSLSLDQEKYAASVHGDLECIACHEDIEEIPHRQNLMIPNSCCNCHDEEIWEKVKQSVHGGLPEDKCAAGCMGCHDPHYGRSKEVWGSEFEVGGCLPCHQRHGGNILRKHSKILPQTKLHLTQLNCNLSEVGCVVCHVPSGTRDPHRIIPAKYSVRKCTQCHSANSILLTEKPKLPEKLLDRFASTKFTNEELMEKGQYVIGANRIPILDTIGIIIFIGTFGLPVIHGGLRFITRKRKEK